jgi:hypothetical protein
MLSLLKLKSDAAQLNSVTLSVPLVLSLPSAEICEPAGTCTYSTQLSGRKVLFDVAAQLKRAVETPRLTDVRFTPNSGHVQCN